MAVVNEMASLDSNPRDGNAGFRIANPHHNKKIEHKEVKMYSSTMGLHLLCDAAGSFDRANSISDLHAETQSFAKLVNFEWFAYVLTINAPSLEKQKRCILNGYPRAWLDTNLERYFIQVDPPVRFGQRSSLPAIWDDESSGDSASEGFWEEARGFGLRSGLTFTVHDRPGITGIFSLGRDRQLGMKRDELAALVGRVQIFATLLHKAVSRIELPKLIPGTLVALTPREQECLRWAADGKTAWEIGQILNITERTAVFHMNNVTQKLGALNKTQAIARALVLNLL